MALTTATVVDHKRQPGSLGALRARRVIITFTAGYDSATGVTLNAKDCGLSEIDDVIPAGPANTGSVVQAVVATGGASAVLTLFGDTSTTYGKVATSDQSATTASVLVVGL